MGGTKCDVDTQSQFQRSILPRRMAWIAGGQSPHEGDAHRTFANRDPPRCRGRGHRVPNRAIPPPALTPSTRIINRQGVALRSGRSDNDGGRGPDARILAPPADGGSTRDVGPSLNVGEGPLETPAHGREVGGHPSRQAAGVPRAGVERRRVQLGPGVARREVDGGVLPDPALRAAQASHVEAVEAHELTGSADLDVAHRLGWPAELRACGVAGHEAEAADPAGQAMATEDAPDAVVADGDAAPALLGQAGADACGVRARVGDGEGQDPLPR